MSNTVGLGEYTKQDILAYLKELGVTVYTQEEVDDLLNSLLRTSKYTFNPVGGISNMKYVYFGDVESVIDKFKEQYEQNN